MSEQYTLERNSNPPFDFYDQVMSKLLRLRHTVPFELPIQQVYEGCMPVTMRHARPDYPPGRMANLFGTMNWSGTHEVEILHVSVETEHEYTKSREAGGGYKEVFWFRPPATVPIPLNSRQVPFFMPLDHPLRLEVREWVLQAMRVESDIQFAASVIDQFSRLSSRTPANLAHLWPELMNFVRLPAGARTIPSKDVERMRDVFDKLVDAKGRNKIIDLLATTVMLRDRDHLPAWVGFHIGGM